MGMIQWLASDYTLRIVALGSAMMGMVSGVVGSFAILKKQGLLGDAVSHASLPGIAIMFILLQTKNTEMFMIGALLSGLLATGLIILIDKMTRIKIDSAMALVLSVFFGIGLVLLTFIQKIPNANQAGLDKFIFGQASTMLRRDVWIIGFVGILLLILVGVFWKEFKIVSFDSEFADSIGFSSRKISYLLSIMIVLSIIIGLQTIGVILMSAMLIAPGVAARQWTNKLSVMVILAGFFGAFSGVLGTIISSSVGKMPTGPSIVLVISMIVILSMTFSPNRGLLWRLLRQKRQIKEITDDQVLMNLYDLALNHQEPFQSHHISAIKPLSLKGKKGDLFMEKTIRHLQDKDLIKKEAFDKWSLTQKGIDYMEDHPMRKEDEYVTTN